MGRLRPLSDAWLFWDAERLDGYPHSDSVMPGCIDTTAAPVEDSSSKPLCTRRHEDRLIYAAGIASALLGAGLAVLLGSFVSAYGGLSEANRGARNTSVDHPWSNRGELELHADAATAIGREPGSVTVSAVMDASPRIESEETSMGQISLRVRR